MNRDLICIRCGSSVISDDNPVLRYIAVKSHTDNDYRQEEILAVDPNKIFLSNFF